MRAAMVADLINLDLTKPVVPIADMAKRPDKG